MVHPVLVGYHDRLLGHLGNSARGIHDNGHQSFATLGAGCSGSWQMLTEYAIICITMKGLVSEHSLIETGSLLTPNRDGQRGTPIFF
ncbi:MAG: hypothetical protein C4346_18715 [Chloroflexota bacterium]